VLANPDDVQQLATFMTFLANDTQGRSAMAVKARQVATFLSWSHMTERYFAVYGRFL
jgi:glycosyltransferase involved in cell wall biosynthesis